MEVQDLGAFWEFWIQVSKSDLTSLFSLPVISTCLCSLVLLQNSEALHCGPPDLAQFQFSLPSPLADLRIMPLSS